MVVEKLEKLLMVVVQPTSTELEIFEYIMDRYGSNLNGKYGIAAASGCVACNSGGGCDSGGRCN